MLTYLRHFRRYSHKLFSKLRGAFRAVKPLRAFTLIELLVVISIMLIITGTILVRQSRFDSSTLLRGLSYSVALTLRSAQIYGTSVRGTATTMAGCLNNTYASGICYASAYGVYFNGATSYTLFADLNNNGTYDVGTDAAVQTYQVGGGFALSKFCGVLANSTRECWLNSGGGTLSWLSVYFKRPNPDAIFKSSTGNTYLSAYIEIEAINDPTNVRCINVTSTGEIAVLQPSQCS
jgi:prepilin-type N-terminal cleavage/methylation domain-containing protein